MILMLFPRRFIPFWYLLYSHIISFVITTIEAGYVLFVSICLFVCLLVCSYVYLCVCPQDNLPNKERISWNIYHRGLPANNTFL